MKLFASHTSPYSRLVIICAHQAGLTDLKLQFVMPWENPAELVAVNPWSQIPALVAADGEVITDSLIICQYFDANALRGAHSCALSGYAIATINQAVKAFSLEKFAPENAVPHPHIQRAKDALARALPKAPTLVASSEHWAQIMLGNALNYVRMRLPETYEKHVSTDNKLAVAEFLKRGFMVKTEQAALEKNPATIGDL